MVLYCLLSLGLVKNIGQIVLQIEKSQVDQTINMTGLKMDHMFKNIFLLQVKILDLMFFC